MGEADFQYCTRFLKKDDLPYIHEILIAPEVMWGTLQVPSRQLGPLMNQWQIGVDNAFDIVAEIVSGPDKGRVVGNCGLHRGSGRRNHVASLGMAVHPDFHGKGIGTSLMSKALEIAEKWWGILRVELEVYEDNVRARRLYEKFGFQVEGRKRDYVIRKGAYVNGLVMGKIFKEGILYGESPLPGGVDGDENAASSCHRAGRNVDSGISEPLSSTGAKAGALEGEVRAPRPSDAESLYRFYSDPRVSRNADYLPWAPPSLMKISSDLETPSPVHVFIYAEKDNILGQVSLTCHANRMVRMGTVTVLLCQSQDLSRCDSSSLSRGVAGLLVGKVVELSEDWLGLHRLELQTYPDEMSLISALEEHGFQLEARVKLASLRDGVYEDKLIWSRISTVW